MPSNKAMNGAVGALQSMQIQTHESGALPRTLALWNDEVQPAFLQELIAHHGTERPAA